MERALQKKRLIKRLTWKKSLLIIGVALVIILLAAGGTAYFLLQKSKPLVNGMISVNGLTAKVEVFRDSHGVPHIEAKSMKDLFMAQGFVTAQDRMFQMDLSRRQASGMLSEVIGEKTIQRDKFFRTLGLRRAAEASYNEYSPEMKQYLEWYAKGVNAYLKQAKKDHTLPIEFMLVGYEPKGWTPIDSLVIGKYMAFDLGGHWEGQAFRYYLMETFSKEKALDLFPGYPKDAPAILEDLETADIDFEKSFADSVIPNFHNGSNNWVVAGSKTESGKPLLANDPHLSLGTPSIWYQSHLKAKDYEVSGVIFAGIPGIIVGHNNTIAWGVTNVGPDVQELYVEKRNPKDPYEFQYLANWEKAEVIDEIIKVKDKTDVNHEVIITRHGPVISEFAHQDKPGTALSLKWTALQPSKELEAVIMMNRSKNWKQFEKALESFHTPAQNFVFASTDGTIAYKANGLIPIRKQDYTSMPVPGWTDQYEWKGYIPWNELPSRVNPENGYLATANNKVTTDSYPYHISDTFAQPYRQQRIVEVLEGKEKLSVKDMQHLQFDQKNKQAEEMLPILIEHVMKEPLTKKEKDVLTILKNWNKVDRKESAAPLIFHIWMDRFSDVLFKDEISDEMLKMFDGREQVVDELIRKANAGQPGPWINEHGGLAKVTQNSFKSMISVISEEYGEDLSKWKWGDFHTLTFEHPLAAIKPLNLLFNPETQAMGGSRVTVGVAGWNRETGDITHGGAWRMVIDMNDPSKAYHVVGPGQSGHVLSPWYDDQAKDWATGKYHVTALDVKDRGNQQKLVLQPSLEK
ncbi:beta-lactam antibiotic acylase [Fictibacillus phosphorivorans]|uniref:Beta-lactam antibiotic acylase n=1 Tax=Fictibacillus phosphorivorans TaxID=1221500 RepID=A0A161TI38_9BACL|nr:penicillin acylase family protein [Fictibacillus phosphorivorans]KZE68804.1 beta-lactam antibiotic acylase [Fictibacillus phosphorivorans]